MLIPTESTLAAADRPLPSARRTRSRGSQILEFTLCFLPLLGFTTVVMDTAWAVMGKATIQRAVRLAVRTGITLTATQVTGSATLTGTVKGLVQSNSFGPAWSLSTANGLNYIKVNYYYPPPSGTSGSVTDVSTCTAVLLPSCPTVADAPGNIMQVSVQNFSLSAVIPRIFGLGLSPDNNPTVVNVYAADVIEPHTNPPAVGTAP